MGGLIESHGHLLRYLLLASGSFAAGVLSAMASGGSFVSFPVILGVGVLPVQANATNTVAQWPGQAISASTLRADIDRQLIPAATFASVLGGAIGAEILLHTTQSSFLRVVPWLILIGTGTFALSKPISHRLWERTSSTAADNSVDGHAVHRAAVFLALLPVAIYLGYFGAGAGFMVLTVMALLGLDNMHSLNAIKVFVVTVSNLVATAMFVFSGSVDWPVCLISIVCSTPGGYLGARWSRHANPQLLRALVIVVGCLVSAYFFLRSSVAHM